MRITVLLFAAARDAAHTSSATIELPAGATVGAALEDLVRAHPALAAVIPSCRAAIDEEFAPQSAPLFDGATLAVLPPVSGG